MVGSIDVVCSSATGGVWYGKDGDTTDESDTPFMGDREASVVGI